MRKWIKFKKKDKGYFNPRTGEDIADIVGLQNRSGIDEFSHRGYTYSKQFSNGIPINETETETILEFDITDQEAADIINDEPGLEPFLIPAPVADDNIGSL